MKVVHVVEADDRGGAARAAARIHTSLRGAGVQSRMQVQFKYTDDPDVSAPRGRVALEYEKLRRRLGRFLTGFEKWPEPDLRSGSWLPSGRHRIINRSDADVVNLHWLNHEMMSIGEIGRITKPIVWTLHDMWAFCGTAHYTTEAAEARWRVGYNRDNRDAEASGPDLDRWTWRRKRRAWRQHMHFVTPSNWLADCVRSSRLLGEFPVVTIPNTLDFDIYRPLDRDAARAQLGLPPRSRLILFGAMGGGRLRRKGFDLLRDALRCLAGEDGDQDIRCLVFGQDEPADPPDLGFPIHWTGHVDDEEKLVRIYNAADVAVVPSRQDVLAQTATEAQACGIPVVAFAGTGVVEAFEDGVTGKCARSGDTEDLARAIAWVLEDADRWRQLSIAARARAMRLWSPDVIAAQYRDVYARAVDAAS